MFDWRNPDYGPIWRARIQRLAKIRSEPKYLAACRVYYKDHIADFINDWGVTVDPRNAGTSRPVLMPFVLFPRQRDFLDWLWERFNTNTNGCLVKSRDCGASWLAMGFSLTLNIFWHDVANGFGSAKEDKVDRSGDPDCLFYKGRKFLEYLPREFRGGFDVRKNTAHMRIEIPDTGGTTTGEAGDNIGRGGRKKIYVVDEFAFVERPKLVDGSLIANTDCRIEMSSVQGTANTFAEHARGGLWARFDFEYQSDPRKCNIGESPVDVLFEDKLISVPPRGLYPDFAKKKAEADPVVWASEYERDFLASVEGILIPGEWVEAAKDAAKKLGIEPTGVKRAAFDPADEGKDKNGVVLTHGIELFHCEHYSGKGSDPKQSTRRVFDLCEENRIDEVRFDGDGMGAQIRVYAKDINTERKTKLPFHMFRGSGEVLDKEHKARGTDRKNGDYFENQKAQSYMAIRWRFWDTYRAVVLGERWPTMAADIISLNPKMKYLTQLSSELSQPTRTWSKTGKLMIDKAPDDVASPNLADACMMAYGYVRSPISINANTLRAFTNSIITPHDAYATDSF